MKFNIANPATAQQKMIDVDDEKKLRNFYDLRMGDIVKGEALGEEFAGCEFRISGGNDKQGFPMKQGVLVQKRVRLLLSKGNSCYRQRRRGERKKKSVRGCIVGSDIAVLNLLIVTAPNNPIAGLTDEPQPRRLGPKRANNIRKLFNLEKSDDVTKYVIAREVPGKDGKTNRKAPKIQRLITPVTLQRKRHRKALKIQAREKARAEASEYGRLLKQRKDEAKAARASARASKRRSSRRSSRKAE